MKSTGADAWWNAPDMTSSHAHTRKAMLSKCFWWTLLLVGSQDAASRLTPMLVVCGVDDVLI